MIKPINEFLRVPLENNATLDRNNSYEFGSDFPTFPQLKLFIFCWN